MTAGALTAAATAAARAGVARATERTGAPRERALTFADFHIHTRFSRDSILSEDKFIRIAIERGLTHVAITNHNNVEGAIAVRDRVRELGLEDRLTVILGEEVSTADGEVVGIFLTRTIPRGLSADETADAIHEQGGLVSIPHPFDPFRPSHIRREPLERLAEAGKIDMVEVFNSRVTFQRHNQEAAEFAARHGIPGIAASDSHSSLEIAMSFNALPAFTTADDLREALPENEWHGSRSTVFIHLTTRWAVLSNIVRRWMGKETAAAPVLGPQPPAKVEEEPVTRPAPSELPNPDDPEAADDRG
ncbi:MAG TPA: PHP domain-containing protein [candidate division Zixibacteria bacterium]|nr:PHP domain-containing protein [candidate division Zixibacteria bacterium]